MVVLSFSYSIHFTREQERKKRLYLQCNLKVYSPTYIYIFYTMPLENTHFLLIFMYIFLVYHTLLLEICNLLSLPAINNYCSYDQVNGPLAVEPKKYVSYPILGSISMASEWKKRYLLESTFKHS